MKIQGVYILLRLLPFSQNRQGILSTRLFFHLKINVLGYCLFTIKYCTRKTVYEKALFFKTSYLLKDFFFYLGFYVAFNTVQVISRRVVGRAEETSTYSSLGFCTVNCRPTASNYQLSHLRP